jgi:hypothetical protein
MSGEWNAPFRALPEDRGRWTVSVLARQARVMHPGDHAVIQLADTSDFVRQGRVLCGHRLANAALTGLTRYALGRNRCVGLASQPAELCWARWPSAFQAH